MSATFCATILVGLAKIYEKLNVNLTSVTTVQLSTSTRKQRENPKQVDAKKRC